MFLRESKFVLSQFRNFLLLRIACTFFVRSSRLTFSLQVHKNLLQEIWRHIWCWSFHWLLKGWCPNCSWYPWVVYGQIRVVHQYKVWYTPSPHPTPKSVSIFCWDSFDYHCPATAVYIISTKSSVMHGRRTVKNIPKYAPAQFYIDNVLPRIKEKKIMALKPFVDRLG